MSRENVCYNIDGKEVWNSRSIVTGLIIVRNYGYDMEVLLVQRGPAVTRTGKWSIPCGYLNWDESIYQSACREAKEETGIYIEPSNIVLCNIVDQYKTRKQNVVLYFITHYDGEYAFPEDILSYSKDETSDLKWVKIFGDDRGLIPKNIAEIIVKTYHINGTTN